MQQPTKKREHYIGVVPQWVLSAVEKNELPLDVMLSYEKLSTIASSEDVCFYDQYLRHAHVYISDAFDDFVNIRLLPENQNWLRNNAERAENARVLFEATLKRVGNNLSDSSVPLTIRSYKYEPISIGATALIFVPTEDATATVVGSTEFFEKALDALAKQLNVKDLQVLDVYQRFCTV